MNKYHNLQNWKTKQLIVYVCLLNVEIILTLEKALQLWVNCISCEVLRGIFYQWKSTRLSGSMFMSTGTVNGLYDLGKKRLLYDIMPCVWFVAADGDAHRQQVVCMCSMSFLLMFNCFRWTFIMFNVKIILFLL